MSKVIPFTGITRLDMPADAILQSAMGKLDGVVILAYDKDGNEYFASSYADGGTVVWLAERAKYLMIGGATQ